jgi:hypothetical protein
MFNSQSNSIQAAVPDVTLSQISNSGALSLFFTLSMFNPPVNVIQSATFYNESLKEQ